MQEVDDETRSLWKTRRARRSGLGTGEKGRDRQVRAGFVVTVETEATDRQRKDDR